MRARGRSLKSGYMELKYGKRGTGTRKMGWVKKIAKKCNRKKGLKHKAGKKKSVCSVCIYWDKSEA